MAADPALRRFASRQRARLFCFWGNDPPALMAAMESHPAWQSSGWLCWARACSSTGQMERACRIVAQFAPKPTLPPETPGADRRTVIELRAAVAASPGDAGAAWRLARAQAAIGDVPGAWTTLHAAAARPGSPPYLHYLEANAAAAAGQWTDAWYAWEGYIGTIPGGV